MKENTPEAVQDATCELLSEIAARNDLRPEDVVSAFFSITPDINADFPARSARKMGWDVPMLDMLEMDVPGALPGCLRVLIHIHGDGAVQHVYLRGARNLRPDLEGTT